MRAKAFLMSLLLGGGVWCSQPSSAAVRQDKSLPAAFAVVRSDFRETLSVYFRNDSPAPVTVKDIFVGDDNVRELAEKGQKMDFREERAGVVRWYDALPETVKPGDFGLVRVRYGKKGELGRNIRVRLISQDGKDVINEELPVMRDPWVQFDYYSFDAGLRKLTLYLDGPADFQLETLYIGGRELFCSVKEIPLAAGKKLLLEATLEEAANEGAYLMVTAVTDKGLCAAPVRAIKPFFSLGMFRVCTCASDGKTGPPPETWLRDCQDHFINTLTYAYESDEVFEQALRYGLRCSFTCHFEKTAEAARRFCLHPASWGWSVCDEPEGWNCPPMRLVKAMTSLRENAPLHPGSMVYCNRRAFFEYDFDDFPFVDYYPVASAPLQGAGRMVEILKSAVRPKPVGFIPQAFSGGVNKKNGNSNLNRWGRFPTPDEERLMVYDAVANGAKALHYFAYNIEPNEPVYGVGETQSREAGELWSEIGRINAELEVLAPYLWCGDVMPLGSSPEENIDVRTILGSDVLTVFLLNRDNTYTREGFASRPRRNIRIKVNVPSWFKPFKVCEVNRQGRRELPYRMNKGCLEVSVPDLRVCSTLVIPGSERVWLDVLGRMFDTLNPVRELVKVPVIDGSLADWEGVEPLVLDPVMARPEFYYSSAYRESDDLNVKIYLGWDRKNLYIAARVKDNIFKQTKSGEGIWSEDALQLAVALPSGIDKTDRRESRSEYGFALTRDGAQAYCWHSLQPAGEGLRHDIPVAVRRTGNLTVYEAAVPLQELQLSPAKPFGLNFAVIDADDGGYWNIPKFMQLSPGIVGGKGVSGFKKFILTEGAGQ